MQRSTSPLAASATDNTTAKPTQTSRVAMWDNARFWLILLVVVAHTISTVRTHTTLGYSLYVIIYLFHMPAMIALSGVFAKAEVTRKTLRGVLQLLLTWLLWEIIWALIHWLSNGQGLPEHWLLVPAWTLWFLLTLATMRVLLPYLAQLRHPLLGSLVIALLAGCSPAIGTQFSASRTLCLLPFFVAGWWLTNRGTLRGTWFTRPSRALRISAASTVVALCGLAAVLGIFRSEWRIDTWLLWREGYAGLFERAPVWGWTPHQWWAILLAGGGIRLLLLLIAAMLTFAILLLVSRRHTRITLWGTRTLYVYLLHAPIVWYLRDSGAITWLGSFSAVGVMLLTGIGIIITVLLSQRSVSQLCRGVVEPAVGRFTIGRFTPSGRGRPSDANVRQSVQ